ncbi:MAG: ferritin-like domain-containing protein [Tatlockia sp.]|nr:ferritin-like domain-containing protein [Tatlockia sp.]
MNQGKISSTSRRNLLKWGLVSLGTLALTTVPTVVTAQLRSNVKTLTFDADDIGILNFALLLEELESAFYAGVVKSEKISNSKERDYMRTLGAQEATHVKFLREVLGKDTLFRTSDLSFNSSGLAAIMTERNTILNTAVTLEDVGVHAYNGAGTSIKNPTYLLAAGSIVSVEARHAAGVRSLLGRSTTELDSDRSVSDADLVASLNPVRGRAYDELYTPKQIVEIVGSLKILNNPINGELVA